MSYSKEKRKGLGFHDRTENTRLACLVFLFFKIDEQHVIR